MLKIISEINENLSNIQVKISLPANLSINLNYNLKVKIFNFWDLNMQELTFHHLDHHYHHQILRQS